MADRTQRKKTPSTLGTCPGCDATIPSGYMLIRYRTEDGWPKMFAECPACHDVVHPT